MSLGTGKRHGIVIPFAVHGHDDDAGRTEAEVEDPAGTAGAPPASKLQGGT